MMLGGGRRSGANEYPQYQSQSIEARVMDRVRCGVTLSQSAHLPILLTGGAPDATSSNELSEAELTQKILKNEFLVHAMLGKKEIRNHRGKCSIFSQNSERRRYYPYLLDHSFLAHA